jgi:ABC-type sugar transport system substrate-binding protein
MAHRVGLLVIAASLWGQAFALSDWSTVAQRAKNSVVKVMVVPPPSNDSWYNQDRR